MLNIRVEKTASPKAKPDMSKVSFGTTFTDHMFLMDFSSDKGWHDPRIVPYGPLPIEPSAAVLNYAMNVFEGLKAYRTADNHIQLFRPDCNIERMNNSADRLSLPRLDPDDALQAIKTLVELDKDWVPRGGGGTGYAKCGGNYAAAQRAGMRAEAKGISQVLWLDGATKQYIEEVGSMNVMFKINGEIVTPTLKTGTVLPGVTRRSILQLLRDRGERVTERLFSVDEFVKAVEAGAIEEAWGCGTAAVVSPIGKLIYNGKEYQIGDGSIGKLTQALYDELTGIQWGRVTDTHGWIVPVC